MEAIWNRVMSHDLNIILSRDTNLPAVTENRPGTDNFACSFSDKPGIILLSGSDRVTGQRVVNSNYCGLIYNNNFNIVEQLNTKLSRRREAENLEIL
jgi:hypothetical protein